MVVLLLADALAAQAEAAQQWEVQTMRQSMAELLHAKGRAEGQAEGALINSREILRDLLENLTLARFRKTASGGSKPPWTFNGSRPAFTRSTPSARSTSCRCRAECSELCLLHLRDVLRSWRGSKSVPEGIATIIVVKTSTNQLPVLAAPGGKSGGESDVASPAA